MISQLQSIKIKNMNRELARRINEYCPATKSDDLSSIPGVYLEERKSGLPQVVSNTHALAHTHAHKIDKYKCRIKSMPRFCRDSIPIRLTRSNFIVNNCSLVKTILNFNFSLSYSQGGDSISE